MVPAFQTQEPRSLCAEAMAFVKGEAKTFCQRWIVGLSAIALVSLFVAGALFPVTPDSLSSLVATAAEEQSPAKAVSRLIGGLLSASASTLATYLLGMFFLIKLYPSAKLRVSVGGFFSWLWGSAMAGGLICTPALLALFLSGAAILTKVLMANPGSIGLTAGSFHEVMTGGLLFFVVGTISAGFAASVYIGLRLSLILPILLFRTASPIKVCWRVTRGRVGRIFGNTLLYWIKIGFYALLLLIPALLVWGLGSVVFGLNIHRNMVETIATGLIFAPFGVIFTCVAAKILADEDAAARKSGEKA